MGFLEGLGLVFAILIILILGVVLFESASCKYNQWKREKTRTHLKTKIHNHFERYWRGEENWSSERVRDFTEDFYWSEWKKR